jgi:hypothetical protein
VIQISCVVTGNWKLETGNWKLKTGNWKLETGNWKLETGNWKLETGNWKLETKKNLSEGSSISPCHRRDRGERSEEAPVVFLLGGPCNSN